MAGSYNHVVEKPSGKLLVPRQLCDMLECRSGDVYEAAEEMYGMIWWLADSLAAGAVDGKSAAELVEEARANYRAGLAKSPGTDGRVPVEDD